MRRLSGKQVRALIAVAMGLAVVLAVVALMLPRQIVPSNAGPGVSIVPRQVQAALPTPSSTAVPKVAPAAPTSITFAVANGVTVKAKVGVVYANQHTDGTWDDIRPPENSLAELAMAFWWGNGLSFQPGDPSSGTTYIYGHACQKYAGCVFNRLGQLRTHDRVTITTTKGALTYEVTQNPQPVPKAELSSSTDVYHNEVNRLVLITCVTAKEASRNLRGVSSNWVVDLRLVGSKPLR